MIWIILPSYNEEASLPILLPELNRVLTDAGTPFSIVVVNDGSTDATALLLEEMRYTMPLHVVEHPLNRGLGETERDAFEFVAARCAADDVIVRVEGDDTHRPEYLLKLIERLNEGFDVVTTSRFQPGGGQVGLNAYRKFVSRCANLLMAGAFRIPGVREYSCGFRAYRAAVVRDALAVFGNNFIQLRGLGFTSTVEILVKLHLLGCRFGEVPFVLRYDRKRSPSKMVGSITTLGYFIMMLLYFWPFGGWRAQYRGLRQLYPVDRESAVARFTWRTLPRRAVSRIGL